MDILLLCAGRINYTHLPVSTNTTNSMIPVNGRPVIGWILDDLLEKGLNRVIVVARAEDEHLQRFLHRVYAGRLQLHIVALTESRSILDSLHHGLEASWEQEVGVVLGDTLIRDPFPTGEDFVYLHEVAESYRWCLALVNADGTVREYRDKERQVRERPYRALCGYYHFTDPVLLKAMLKQALADGKTQISDLLTLYQTYRPIRARTADAWYDFGNIDNLLHSKQQLLQSRYFNTLTVDPVLNTITKVSSFDAKLQQELHWYESLPAKLQVLAPRIIGRERHNGKLHLTQEYYGYPTLAELFLYGDLDAEDWRAIFRKLMEIHREFRKFPHPVAATDCRNIYLDKTFERLQALRAADPEWEEIFSSDDVVINGKVYLNFPQLEQRIRETACRISETVQGAIIHGDFCFSNILFDYTNQIARLIDPRGSFGRPGIYGDPRYDLAKLRHSVAGRYDYIVSDLFTVEAEGNRFQYTLFDQEGQDAIAALLDEAIQAEGYDLMEIKFIEALLFISMLPLHRDKPQRQKIMYLTGIQRLNEVFQ